MSEKDLNLNSTWKKAEIPRGSQISRHNKTAYKTTVSLYLSKNLVEKAKKQGLNLSRILEEALNSILTYMETQKTEIAPETSSGFLGKASFLKEGLVGRAGFEPATLRFLHHACTLGRLNGTHHGWASTASPPPRLVRRLGSSTKLSYRPNKTVIWKIKIYAFRAPSNPFVILK